MSNQATTQKKEVKMKQYTAKEAAIAVMERLSKKGVAFHVISFSNSSDSAYFRVGEVEVRFSDHKKPVVLTACTGNAQADYYARRAAIADFIENTESFNLEVGVYSNKISFVCKKFSESDITKAITLLSKQSKQSKKEEKVFVSLKKIKANLISNCYREMIANKELEVFSSGDFTFAVVYSKTALNYKCGEVFIVKNNDVEAAFARNAAMVASAGKVRNAIKRYVYESREFAKKLSGVA